MTTLKESLALRATFKKRKPEFLKQDAHKHKKLEHHWRKPKGQHSKMRRHFKGRRRMPNIGYSSPSLARGRTPEGFLPRIVHRIEDLAQGMDAVLIGRTVGLRKRLAIVAKAQQLQIKILNVKDPAALQKKATALLAERKAKRSQKKAKTEKAAKAPAPAKKEATPELTAEEKQKQAEEEKRKVLEAK